LFLTIITCLSYAVKYSLFMLFLHSYSCAPELCVFYVMTCLHIHTFTHSHIYTFTYLHIHIPTHSQTYTFTYLHIHTPTHSHTYTFIYLHIHASTHLRTHSSFFNFLKAVRPSCVCSTCAIWLVACRQCRWQVGSASAIVTLLGRAIALMTFICVLFRIAH
jgi:hypothetical protein